jgi:hypothetical protein
MPRRRRGPNERVDAVTVVHHFETDVARVAKALLVVLTYRAPTTPDVEPTRTNATAAEAPVASTKTGTVTSSATYKQGSNHDTTRLPS